MGKHVMVDLETLGNGPASVILSIGAVKFDPNFWREAYDPSRRPEPFDRFYVTVDPTSAVAAGLRMDAETVMWWLHEDRAAARAALMMDPGERVGLAEALDGFARWFGSESLPTWGNGATFDNVIMATAFKATGIPQPWKFWHDRCYRTIKQLRPDIKMPTPDIAHHALYDAEAQAKHLVRLATQLNLELG